MKFVRNVVKTILNLYALGFYRRNITPSPCDILFLYTWAGEAERTSDLSAALQMSGLNVGQASVPSSVGIVQKRLLSSTARISSFENCIAEYFAAYIVRRYRPKIIAMFDDGTPHTIYFKHEVEKIGGKLVHIAHGITGDSASFTNFLFHYYFVFGQSSVEAVLRQKTRFGTTKLVKTGSYLISPDDALPVNTQRKTVLFCSTWLPVSVKDVLLRNMGLFAAWAEVQKDYEVLIKHHPLEDESVIQALLKNVSHITFLPKEITMKDALRTAALTITCWSVSSIEAALMNRPTVIVNDSDMPDFLEIENYFLHRARTVREIDARIKEAFLRYEELLLKAPKYVERHLAHTNDSIPYIAAVMNSICRNREDFEYMSVPGTMEYPA